MKCIKLGNSHVKLNVMKIGTSFILINSCVEPHQYRYFLYWSDRYCILKTHTVIYDAQWYNVALMRPHKRGLTLASAERPEERHPLANHIIIDVLEYLAGVLDATRRPLARPTGAGQHRSDGGRGDRVAAQQAGVAADAAASAAAASGRQAGGKVIAET